ncbi:alpha/beta hydrolase [Microvirga sp. 3-52]|uniref:alpha/beta fold hydrolase n=1 Tax=Microvirga sp. 3-52 TaxID=2792425 RepID=UPI001AC950FE|nr:alpha/beta hydrolase [Microvirga sp. 3-52]MBO1907914.1 alpha/beta hydrolase [Microvirga sp. 3-52]MBS7455114.1 alpha/beta hydrolase [Microvirga sp. 3-52]
MPNRLIADRDRFASLHPEQRIANGGREWGYVQAGDRGPALLLIPGTLGRGDIFWQQIEALKDRARIVAVTYPGSGGVTEWAGDLAELCGRLELGRVTILGSSLGGYVAQYFAATYPNLAERLIAANTLHSVADVASRPPYSSDLDNAPIEEIRAGFGRGLGAWRDDHPEQAELIDLLMAEVAGRIPELELRTRLNALKRGPALPPLELPRDGIATIEGADDPLIPPQMRDAVRARLNPSVAYLFEWGGHFPYVVRPDLYVSLLEEQLGVPVTGDGWGKGEMRAR